MVARAASSRVSSRQQSRSGSGYRLPDRLRRHAHAAAASLALASASCRQDPHEDHYPSTADTDSQRSLQRDPAVVQAVRVPLSTEHPNPLMAAHLAEIKRDQQMWTALAWGGTLAGVGLVVTGGVWTARRKRRQTSSFEMPLEMAQAAEKINRLRPHRDEIKGSIDDENAAQAVTARMVNLKNEITTQAQQEIDRLNGLLSAETNASQKKQIEDNINFFKKIIEAYKKLSNEAQNRLNKFFKSFSTQLDKFTLYGVVALFLELPGKFLQRIVSKDADVSPLYNPDSVVSFTLWNFIPWASGKLIYGAMGLFGVPEFSELTRDDATAKSWAQHGDTHLYSPANALKVVGGLVFTYLHQGHVRYFEEYRKTILFRLADRIPVIRDVVHRVVDCVDEEDRFLWKSLELVIFTALIYLPAKTFDAVIGVVTDALKTLLKLRKLITSPNWRDPDFWEEIATLGFVVWPIVILATSSVPATLPILIGSVIAKAVEAILRPDTTLEADKNEAQSVRSLNSALGKASLMLAPWVAGLAGHTEAAIYILAVSYFCDFYIAFFTSGTYFRAIRHIISENKPSQSADRNEFATQLGFGLGSRLIASAYTLITLAVLFRSETPLDEIYREALQAKTNMPEAVGWMSAVVLIGTQIPNVYDEWQHTCNAYRDMRGETERTASTLEVFSPTDRFINHGVLGMTTAFSSLLGMAYMSNLLYQPIGWGFCALTAIFAGLKFLHSSKEILKDRWQAAWLKRSSFWDEMRARYEAYDQTRANGNGSAPKP